MLMEIASRIQKGLDRHSLDNTLKFDCGEDGVISLVDGRALLENMETDCTIRISASNLDKLIHGKLNPMSAFALGKIKVSGDMSVAMKLGKLLG